MPAKIADLEFEEGSAFEMSLRLVSKDSCRGIDVTGYRALFQVRVSRDPTSTLIYTASTANGYIEVQPGGNAGLFLITIPRDVVDSQITWNRGHWDFVLWGPTEDPLTQAKRKAEGRARFQRAVVLAGASSGLLFGDDAVAFGDDTVEF